MSFKAHFTQFAAATLLALVIAGTSLHEGRTSSTQLSANQETAAVGAGFKCDFLAGASAGVAVGTLFGCIPCGAGAIVGGAIWAIAC